MYELEVHDLHKRRNKLVERIRKYEADGKTKKLMEINEEFKKISKTLKELEEKNNKGIIH